MTRSHQSALVMLCVCAGVVIILYYSTSVFEKSSKDAEKISNQKIFTRKEETISNEKTFTRKDFINQKTIKKKPVILEPLASRTLKPAGNAPPSDELERIWNYVYDRQYRCTESLYLGGEPKMLGDGAYALCIEDQFWPLEKNPKHPCLMYSFGVANDLSFDNAVAKRGCEVHSFDPSITMQDGSKNEAGVTFHKVGIAAEDSNNGHKGWKMRTLKTLMKELGHTNRYLDYLKVDTDRGDGFTGFEDVVVKYLLDSGMHQCVRQYVMEIHMPGPLTNPDRLERCRMFYRQMVDLNTVGWRLYNTSDNKFLTSTNPDYSRITKQTILTQAHVMYWETAFVNFDVNKPCITG